MLPANFHSARISLSVLLFLGLTVATGGGVESWASTPAGDESVTVSLAQFMARLADWFDAAPTSSEEKPARELPIGVPVKHEAELNAWVTSALALHATGILPTLVVTVNGGAEEPMRFVHMGHDGKRKVVVFGVSAGHNGVYTIEFFSADPNSGVLRAWWHRERSGSKEWDIRLSRKEAEARYDAQVSFWRLQLAKQINPLNGTDQHADATGAKYAAPPSDASNPPDRPPKLIPKSCASEHPQYPPAAVRANEQGTTRVTIYVNSSGEVTKSDVSSSSGFERLDRASADYFASCRFEPAISSGVSTASKAVIEYRWRIEP